MSYTHLTPGERYQIYILKQDNRSQSEIAKLMKRDKSTISRELGQRGYRPKQSHEASLARLRSKGNGRRVCAETWAFAEAKLGLGWSPEQISGYLKANGMPTVSNR